MITVILFALLLSFQVYSSDLDNRPPLKWVKLCKGISVSSGIIVEVSDNSFLYASKNVIAIISKNDGSLIKNLTGFTDINSIKKTNENNFIMADYNKLTLFDQDMNIIWSKPLLSSNLSLISAIQTRDSCYAAIGKNLIIKTDKNGNMIKTIEINPPDTIENPVLIEFAETGNGFFVCGKGCNTEICLTLDSWVSRLSVDGKELWTMVLSGYEFFDMVPVKDDVILTGAKNQNAAPLKKKHNLKTSLHKTNYFPIQSIPLLRINPQGNVIFNEEFGGTKRDCGYFVRHYNNTYLLSCGISTWDIEYFSLIVTDETGAMKWSEDYKTSFSNPNANFIVQPLSKGDLAVIAWDSLHYYSHSGSGAERKYKKENGFTKNNGAITMISNGFIHFTIIKPSRTKLELISIDGKTVLNLDIGFLQAGDYYRKIEKIATGSYTLIFQFNEQIIPKKLIMEQ